MWIPGKDRTDRRFERFTACSMFPPGKDADGNKLCAWCGAKTKSNRNKYCSKECADEVGIRGGFLMLKIFQRDNYICQICGIDTRALEKLIHEGYSRWKGERYVGFEKYPFTENLGLKDTFKTLSEADHIIPVSEGGGTCGLENYRTLCYWCHKAETKKLAAEQAKKRREEKAQGDLFSMST